jgi:hypothetical protein
MEMPHNKLLFVTHVLRIKFFHSHREMNFFFKARTKSYSECDERRPTTKQIRIISRWIIRESNRYELRMRFFELLTWAQTIENSREAKEKKNFRWVFYAKQRKCFPRLQPRTWNSSHSFLTNFLKSFFESFLWNTRKASRLIALPLFSAAYMTTQPGSKISHRKQMRILRNALVLNSQFMDSFDNIKILKL